MTWKPKDYRDKGKTLEWGKDISKENMELLRAGEVFTLVGKDGKPYSKVLMDSYDELREQYYA